MDKDPLATYRTISTQGDGPTRNQLGKSTLDMRTDGPRPKDH